MSHVAKLSEVSEAVCCYQRRHLGGWGRRGAGSPVSWWPALCSGRQRTTYCPPPAALRRPCSVLRVLRAAAAATRRAPTSGGRVSSGQDTAARGLRTAGCWSSDNRTTHRLYQSGTALEKWRFTETCFRWSWFKLGRSMVVSGQKPEPSARQTDMWLHDTNYAEKNIARGLRMGYFTCDMCSP